MLGWSVAWRQASELFVKTLFQITVIFTNVFDWRIELPEQGRMDVDIVLRQTGRNHPAFQQGKKRVEFVELENAVLVDIAFMQCPRDQPHAFVIERIDTLFWFIPIAFVAVLANLVAFDQIDSVIECHGSTPLTVPSA